ncbi:MAG: alpha/beta hydrolase [Chloroflexi bacterium]|nr:alpha/beta hydrolase [Chloroflexota bacterium]MCI0578036.1 alpha/beta hydrolase [Chloroflexota bacterium]MCI0644750.1 alpha/beta hydrolase [Chloroflexota bacterium]MCI0728655.1 alpha/beta hydrolase [Chloroflexota bacterium]
MATPDTGLELHIRDVTQVLEYEDLQQVVLVGHSYGGMVITGIAEVSKRVAQLVYLDAFVPTHGQSAFDITPIPGHQADWTRRAMRSGNGWLVPPPAPEAMGLNSPEDIAWLKSRLTPMPLLTHEQPLEAPQGMAEHLPRTYILCKHSVVFRETAAKAKAAGWDYAELDTGHEAMVTMPGELARLLNLAASKIPG